MNYKLVYDYVIIGSGFGGSVAALRLSEKGYQVLILEKGKELKAADFPKTNWNLKRWMWVPALRFFGFFKLTFFRHITVLSGVGVGGGSLVYANTLPIPKDTFFSAKSWAGLADWKKELANHYLTAKTMLGTTRNPRKETGDKALQTLAGQIGKPKEFELTEVAVFFGEPEKKVPDPFFGGKGPERKGCTFCGGCMTGCRFDAKNTLDKNYLYLARAKGAELIAEAKVTHVTQTKISDELDRYNIQYRKSTRLFSRNKTIRTKGVVFSGGVLGTVPLLLKLKKKSLPNLSDQIGNNIRTNSESLVGVTTFDKKTVFSDGVAIGSILHTDEYSHIEPVRYSSGSGFWRILLAPMVSGSTLVKRFGNLLFDLIRHPIKNLSVLFTWDFAKHTQILLFMQTINSTLKFSPGLFGLKSSMEAGPRPTAFIPEAQDLVNRYAKIVNGKPVALLTETIAGIPTTAHILGGCVMGTDSKNGVIDKNHRVFGYENMYICDGSAISANPGVNPSLTITALSERAMSKIPAKNKKF
ncbi:MAG: GMC family oxidoreductase [Desulfobacula sp.]|nr:GMC family oxidoreductase [Desulfobacula sp.]